MYAAYKSLPYTHAPFLSTHCHPTEATLGDLLPARPRDAPAPLPGSKQSRVRHALLLHHRGKSLQEQSVQQRGNIPGERVSIYIYACMYACMYIIFASTARCLYMLL